MLALKRVPWRFRQAKAREWGRRGHEAKAHLRAERGPAFDTLLAQAKQDRRGMVLHSGHLYRADGRVQLWQVRWSVAGRCDQFDILLDGRVWKTGGRERVAEWLPGLRLPTRRQGLTTWPMLADVART